MDKLLKVLDLEAAEKAELVKIIELASVLAALPASHVVFQSLRDFVAGLE